MNDKYRNYDDQSHDVRHSRVLIFDYLAKNSALFNYYIDAVAHADDS